MNGVYFFLPFFLVAGLGIYQDSFAITQITGYDFFDVTNPDGTHTWTSHEPYIFDGNNYVPFIASGTTVQTEHGSVILNADGSYSFYKKGIISGSPLFTDKIVAKYADVTNLNTWTYPATLNNAVPNNSWDGTQLTASKTKSGIGLLDYKYIIDNGKWKTQLEATNLSSLTTKAFGFDQIIDLNRDTIKFGENNVNLDNYNGVTFDKAWLTNNKSKVLNFLNDVFFDFDLGFDNLYSVTVYDTGVGKSQFVFDYRTSTPLLPSTKLIIDPTYSYTSGSQYRYKTSDVTGDCPTTYQTRIASTYTNAIDYQPTGAVNACYFSVWEWDLSSLPNVSAVTDTKIKYSVSGHTGTNPAAASCDFVPTRDFTQTGQSIIDDIENNTPYVNDDTSCASVQTLYELDLGTTADTDIKSAINGDDLFNVGMKFSTLTRTASDTWLDNTAMQLQIVYTTIPAADAIDDLVIDAVTDTTASVSWTQPALNGGNLTNYKLLYTTPYGTPGTFLANTTDIFYGMTGLSEFTQYSVRVSALTEGGYNFTGNILNFTTAGPPEPVDDLTGSSTSFSTIELSWTLPELNNGTLSGYQINYTTPIGNPNTVIINNTGTSDTNYEIFGLTETSEYSFRVGVWTNYGFNGSGNIWNGSTTANFEIGNISVPTDENPNRVDITFTRTDNNSTQTTIDVKFPNTFTALDCDLGYQFANTNQTYNSLSSSVYDADYNTTSFVFNGVQNEIIKFHCWDAGDTSLDGRYIVTQTGFPLLDEINNFRNGTYGTQGMFGVVDFITLCAIIFSMIGFNRVNEAVGTVFNIVLIGVLGYFEIITVPTIIFGAIAVIVMFAITSTKKD